MDSSKIITKTNKILSQTPSFEIWNEFWNFALDLPDAAVGFLLDESKRLLEPWPPAMRCVIIKDNDFLKNAQNPAFSLVRDLNIKGRGLLFQPLGGKVVQQIVSCYNFENLAHLTLSGLGIGDQSAAMLAAYNFSDLRTLDLGYNNIGDNGAAAITRGQWHKLHELALCQNNIEERGTQAILSHFPNLDELRLWEFNNYNRIGRNRMGDLGAISLAKSSFITDLSQEDLEDQNLGANGLQALLSTKHVQSFSQLHLTYNNIGDKGAFFLAESGALAGMNNLFDIFMADCGVSKTGAIALLNSPNLPPNLLGINLDGNHIHADEAGELLDTVFVKNGGHVSADDELIDLR